MFVKAVIAIAHRGCFTQRLVGAARMTHLSSDAERDILVLQADDADVDAFLGWLRETRRHVEVIERGVGVVAVHTSALPDGVVRTIVSERCTILWPATFSDTLERYTVLAPARAHLDRLNHRLRSMGQTRIEWLGEVPLAALHSLASPLVDATSTFTRKQLEVLRLAAEEGYYESPRRVNAAALAGRVGISASTFEEHLRKGERRVLERFVTLLRSNPEVECAAVVGPGRPRGSKRR